MQTLTSPACPSSLAAFRTGSEWMPHTASACPREETSRMLSGDNARALTGEPRWAGHSWRTAPSAMSQMMMVPSQEDVTARVLSWEMTTHITWPSWLTGSGAYSFAITSTESVFHGDND